MTCVEKWSDTRVTSQRGDGLWCEVMVFTVVVPGWGRGEVGDRQQYVYSVTSATEAEKILITRAIHQNS